MKTFRKVVAATLLVLVVIVVLQNTETVETRLLFVTLAMPRSLLLFITLVLGAVIGLLLGARWARPRA